MKRITLLILFVSGFLNAQEIPKLKLTPNNVEPIVVVVEGLKAADLYKKTLNWVQETYRNPEYVLKAKIENEKIRVEALAENAWWYRILGMKQPYDMNYTLEISFKDGKYRFEYLVGRFKLSSGGGVAFTYKDFFKNTGEPRKSYNEAIPTLEETINKFSLSYYNYITGSTAKKNDNW